MTAGAGESLLGRVVSSIASSNEPDSGRAHKSIFSQAAASFGRRPTGAESTIPTGFDPQAASLFEAVVEAAFLVANADGVFDDAERMTFERVVAAACQNTVQSASLHALVSDLVEQFEEDGLDRRVQMVGSVVHSHEHKTEVLRIAALMAHVSGGVHDSERRVIEKLAHAFGLGSDAVVQCLSQARQALDG